MKTKEPTIWMTKEMHDEIVLEDLFQKKYLEYIAFHEFIPMEEFRKIYSDRLDFTK